MSFNPNEFDRSYPAAQSDSLGQYTAKTFLWVMAGLLITFSVAMISWSTNFTIYTIYHMPYIHLILLVATLVLSFTMASRVERMRVETAIGIFVAFSVLFGFTMSIYLLIYEVTSIIFVFLLTALYFGGMAAYGLLTRRDLSGVGKVLFFGLIFLIVCGVLSIFIPGVTVFDRVICLAGIAVFLGYTAYDTQKIKAFYHYYAGDAALLAKASIFSALQLYLDFLNLFVYLLRFLGSRRR